MFWTSQAILTSSGIIFEGDSKIFILQILWKVQPLVLSAYLGPNPGFGSYKCLFSTLSSWGHTWSNHSRMLVVYIEREAEMHREQKSIENTPIPPRIFWAPPSPAGSLLAQPWAVDPWSLLLPAGQSWFCTFFPNSSSRESWFKLGA